MPDLLVMDEHSFIRIAAEPQDLADPKTARALAKRGRVPAEADRSPVV
jgi:hypothetical protein